jgi:hypothetical protein
MRPWPWIWPARALATIGTYQPKEVLVDLALVLKLLECTKLSSATPYAGPGHPADL